MAETPSTMLPLGTPLPDFALPNAVDGETVTPGRYAGVDVRDSFDQTASASEPITVTGSAMACFQ